MIANGREFFFSSDEIGGIQNSLFLAVCFGEVGFEEHIDAQHNSSCFLLLMVQKSG